ncbi:hypothetical protein MPER_08415, partial [Moniliophthora perniciosa FA553]
MSIPVSAGAGSSSNVLPSSSDIVQSAQLSTTESLIPSSSDATQLAAPVLPATSMSSSDVPATKPLTPTSSNDVPATKPLTSTSSNDVPATEPLTLTSSNDVLATKTVKKKKQRSDHDNVLLARGADDKRIKTWFANQATKLKGSKSEPWAPFINHFTEGAGPPPRHVPPHKVYGGQEEFKDKIDQEVLKTHGEDGLTSEFCLTNHVQSAKVCFDNENEEIKERVRKDAIDLYQKRKSAYEKALNGDDLLEQDRIPGMRGQMSAKLQPFVDRLARCTKTHVSLVAVGYNEEGEDEDQAFFCNVLSGATPGWTKAI